MTEEVNARKEWIGFLASFYNIKHDKALEGDSYRWYRISPIKASQMRDEFAKLTAAIQPLLVTIPKLELKFEHAALESVVAPGRNIEQNAYAGRVFVFVARSYNEYKALQISALELPNAFKYPDASVVTRIRESWMRLNRGCFGDNLTAKDKFPRLVVCTADTRRPIFSSGYTGFGRFAVSNDLAELRSSVIQYAKRLVIYRTLHNGRKEDAAWAAANYVDNPMQQHMLDAFIKTNYLENHAFKRRALRAAKTAVRRSEDS